MRKQVKPEPFHKSLPPKLVRLLRGAKKRILTIPGVYDQYEWSYPAKTPCGTRGCIAWQMALQDLPKHKIREALAAFNPIRHSGMRGPLARLTHKWRRENIQPLSSSQRRAFKMLFGVMWPRELTRGPKHNWKITRRLAAKAIDRFLETGSLEAPHA
jgi:hypothetical protein